MTLFFFSNELESERDTAKKGSFDLENLSRRKNLTHTSIEFKLLFTVEGRTLQLYRLETHWIYSSYCKESLLCLLVVVVDDKV